MKRSLKSYREHRDSLLTRISEILSKDERLIAGWLTGSIGRNEEDSLSDIDLSLVVSDEFSTSLCARLEQVSAQTSPDRYLLFSQFGNLALVHENNNNAPEGGTFTFVLYAESAVMIDWVLVPQAKAARPFQSRLLFDKVGIPISPPAEPENLEQSKKSVAEMWAFFWMMTAVTIKYIHRDDGVFAAEWIEHLQGLIYEVERRLKRESWKYTRGSFSKLKSTREKQLESIHELCKRMQALKPKVAEFTESEPLIPLAEIESLLSLSNK
ncbi:MAG: aminoglycoside 6-adenylyltransferase [Anaerolineae bacterium]|nr:aminoglycoside 6-adenylyltransferase [Anaerolineae bacterium]MCI0610527.1 aminoglycoside 6-adenylyltransferase [Anaerolineae bacterium]